MSGNSVNITAKNWQLFIYLTQRPGKWFTSYWPPREEGEENSSNVVG